MDEFRVLRLICRLIYVILGLGCRCGGGTPYRVLGRTLNLIMPTSFSLLAESDRFERTTDELRNQALARLYMRKAVVDDLIRSLETYQRFPVRKGPAQCIPIRKC